MAVIGVVFALAFLLVAALHHGEDERLQALVLDERVGDVGRLQRAGHPLPVLQDQQGVSQPGAFVAGRGVDPQLAPAEAEFGAVNRVLVQAATRHVGHGRPVGEGARLAHAQHRDRRMRRVHAHRVARVGSPVAGDASGDIRLGCQRGHRVVYRQQVVEQVVGREFAGDVPEVRAFQAVHRREGRIGFDGIQVERDVLVIAGVAEDEGRPAVLDPGPDGAFGQQLVNERLSQRRAGDRAGFGEESVERFPSRHDGCSVLVGGRWGRF